MWRSIAQIVCGAPKPRNAPFGGVFVATACASIDDVLPAVRPGRVERAAREHDGGERHVGAAVQDDPDRDGAERPVAVAAGRDRDERRVALRRRLDVLLAVVDHLDGPAARLREEESVEREDRRVLLLAPEAAARDGLRHVDAFVRQGERAPDPLVDVVRALARREDVRASAPRPRTRALPAARGRRAPGAASRRSPRAGRGRPRSRRRRRPSRSGSSGRRCRTRRSAPCGRARPPRRGRAAAARSRRAGGAGRAGPAARPRPRRGRAARRRGARRRTRGRAGPPR